MRDIPARPLTRAALLAMGAPFEQGPVFRNRLHPDIDSLQSRDSAAPLLLRSD